MRSIIFVRVRYNTAPYGAPCGATWIREAIFLGATHFIEIYFVRGSFFYSYVLLYPRSGVFFVAMSCVCSFCLFMSWLLFF